MRFFKKKVIYGCEQRGDYNMPYLTRFTIVEFESWQLCLHKFHRSDAPEIHDHPWNFVSLILWQGYIEEVPNGSKRFWRDFGTTKTRYLPGMILFRDAEYAHRVELIKDKKTGREKPAITLVFMGKSFRKWGFWDRIGWTYWKTYESNAGC